MEILISYDQVVELVANPPTLAPCPNLTNLRALHYHLQCALQSLSCPQSNIFGWPGLVMSCPMYLLLSRTAFHLPSNPSPQAIYYGLRTTIVNQAGNPVPNTIRNPMYIPLPTLDCAHKQRLTQALCECKATGYHTRTSRVHATTCSTAALLMN
jgi:hypothetical protein